MTAATLARAVVWLPHTTAAAQHLIEQHLQSAPYSGKCSTCGEIAPCRSRELAYAAFLRLGTLPRRTRHYRSTR